MLQDGEKEVIFEFLSHGRETFLWEEATGNGKCNQNSR
jgi:hypothetical protein